MTHNSVGAQMVVVVLSFFLEAWGGLVGYLPVIGRILLGWFALSVFTAALWSFAMRRLRGGACGLASA